MFLTVSLAVSKVGIYKYYQYSPSLAASSVFTAFFALCTLILMYQAIRSRTLFLWWIVLCAGTEMAGYLTRIILIEEITRDSYIAQLIIIILAPNMISLVNYIVVGRIIQYGELPKSSYWSRHPKYIARLFVCSDLMGLTLQGIGGAFLSAANPANGTHDANVEAKGKALTLAGLGVQLGFVGLFMAITVWTYMKMTNGAKRIELRWTWVCMYATMTLVIIRNLFRCIEFAEGSEGYLDSTEIWFLMFDATLISIALLVFIVLDLGRDWVMPNACRHPTDAVAPAESTEMAEKDVYMYNDGEKAHDSTVIDVNNEVASPAVSTTQHV